MSLSCRRYLVDKNGAILRLKSSMFDRLVRDPFHHAMPDLAGQRPRVAEVTVERRDRVPVRVYAACSSSSRSTTKGTAMSIASGSSSGPLRHRCWTLFSLRRTLLTRYATPLTASSHRVGSGVQRLTGPIDRLRSA